MKVKFYEFAGRIVGKCLYESALGSTRRINVKARLSRSFLAQLLGLRVSYRVRRQTVVLSVSIMYLFVLCVLILPDKVFFSFLFGR